MMSKDRKIKKRKKAQKTQNRKNGNKWQGPTKKQQNKLSIKKKREELYTKMKDLFMPPHAILGPYHFSILQDLSPFLVNISNSLGYNPILRILNRRDKLKKGFGW